VVGVLFFFLPVGEGLVFWGFLGGLESETLVVFFFF